MDNILGKENIIYVIFHYNFNTNIYDVMNSIYKFCFAFCTQSQKNTFKIFLIFDNFFWQIFPHKVKDTGYFLCQNFSEIEETIKSNIKEFFNKYDTYTKNQINVSFSSPLNQIFKKILLENNRVKIQNNLYNNGNELIPNFSQDEKNNSIILISDCIDNSQLFYEQKYLYLLKKDRITIDCIHLGKHKDDYNSKFESICLYSEGVFENIENVFNEDNNLTQILIQEFLPITGNRKKKHQKVYIINNQNNSNYKIIACDKCNKECKEETYYSSKLNKVLCKKCFTAESQ